MDDTCLQMTNTLKFGSWKLAFNFIDLTSSCIKTIDQYRMIQTAEEVTSVLMVIG